MDVYMIWVQEAGCAWLVDSWDDDSISADSSGWDAALAKAAKEHKDFRIVKARVDFDKVLAAFKPAETTLTMEEPN